MNYILVGCPWNLPEFSFVCGAGYTSDCKQHKWAKKYHKNPNEPSLKIASKPKHNTSLFKKSTVYIPHKPEDSYW